MRRVTAAGVKESNLKCEVTHEVKGDQTPPTVHVTFSEWMLLWQRLVYAHNDSWCTSRPALPLTCICIPFHAQLTAVS